MSTQITLEKLGLSPKEASVYQALLKTGGGTGYQIAQHLGIKRSSAYFFLDELRKKGLATRHPEANRHRYVPKDPRELITETKKLALDVESMVPELLASAQLDNKPTLLYFEGGEGFIQGRNEIIKRARPGDELIAFYAYEPNPTDDLNEIARDFFNSLKKHSITLRAFTPDHMSTRTFIKGMTDHGNWELRFLPIDTYPSRSSFEVIGNYLIVHDRPTGQHLFIENKNLANTIRFIFDMLWNETCGV